MEVITVTGVIHLPLTWMVTLREMSHHGDTQKTDINTVLRPLLGMTGNWQTCLCFISRPTIFAHSKLSPFFWCPHCSLWHCAQFYSSTFMTEPKDSCKGHKNSNDLVMYQSKCIIFCQATKQCYSIFFSSHWLLWILIPFSDMYESQQQCVLLVKSMITGCNLFLWLYSSEIFCTCSLLIISWGNCTSHFTNEDLVRMNRIW